MKTALFLLLVASLSGCQHMTRTATKTKARDPFEEMRLDRESKRMNLQRDTEARARSYEKQGYRPGEARAIAEVEYFRTGR